MARSAGATFAKRVFGVAGAYGLIVLLPQFFLEERIGVDNPPPITHPEYFYGMMGVAAAWQVAFLAIARDPVRLRPVMPAAVIEKFSFAIAAAALYAEGRIGVPVLAFAGLDGLLGLLFVAAYFAIPSPADAAALSGDAA